MNYVGCNPESVGADLDRARERIAELEAIIRDCQDVLTAYLPPDGLSKKDAISCLLEILDGPHTRAVLPNKT